MSGRGCKHPMEHNFEEFWRERSGIYEMLLRPIVYEKCDEINLSDEEIQKIVTRIIEQQEGHD